MARIWLNHWFSTAYNIINLMKEGEDGFVVIGSNKNEKSVISCACDEWYQEPDIKGEEYVSFCLEFCKEHKIDLFMPRKELLAISKHKQEFEVLGTQVMVDDYEILSILNNKSSAYELFQKLEIGMVPDYRIITSADEFQDAYSYLIQKYEKLCFKFVNDEGGMSFRVIDNGRKGYESLFVRQSSRMCLEEVLEALRERETTDPIMLMPYLPGHEISVDCFKTESGVIMLPRDKGVTRVERLVYDEKILEICRDFYDKVGLEWPCNIQFKYLDDIPYFLEVNTRMSGGIQMSCLAAGVNIPNLAVNKILGIHKEWNIQKESKSVSYVEMPMLV